MTRDGREAAARARAGVGPRLAAFLSDPRTILAFYLGAAVLASLQAYLAPPSGHPASRYNNFQIFRQSFQHLVAGHDLYVPYPGEHVDLYKYSPTFALLFAPFSAMPLLPAMCAWNALNAGALYLGIQRFPYASERARVVAWWLCFVEGWGALQHFQTNSLIAGLLLLAASAVAARREVPAAAAVLATAFIKVFGLAGLALWRIAPRPRRFALGTIAVAAALVAAPLAVVPPARLLALYGGWLDLLRADHGASYGYSVMGWLHAWFALDPPKTWVVAAGTAVVAAAFLRAGPMADATQRSLLVAALLIWMVIFNHKAEGPTFVIAMAGVTAWYGARPRSRGDALLLAAAFVIVSLSPTEVFPRVVRQHLVPAYVLKAVPCIVVWVRCVGEALTRRESPAAAPIAPWPR